MQFRAGPVLVGRWTSTTYGGFGSCYEALGGENVVVDVCGDSNDGRAHRELGTVTASADLGSCEIDATNPND